MERIDIKTGYLCNNNCLFCVQAHNKKYGNRTFDQLTKVLDDAYKDGVRGVVFTGGEFTLRSDCIKLIKYAHDLGFDLIQLQSNGRSFSSEKFVDACIAAGANEFSPALHGYTAEIHDYLTRANGAWSQTVKGIQNIVKRGYNTIVNSVVVKPNYRYVPELAKLFVKLDVDQFQFAFVHAVGNAMLYYDKMIPFVSLVSPYVKKGLQIGLDNNKRVMAEAMPYCVMQGYERYVSELYIPQTRISEGNELRLDFETIRKTQGKTLFPQCLECAFSQICEGPWLEYPQQRGSSEFKPVPGKKILSTQEILDDYIRFPENPFKAFGPDVFRNDFRIRRGGI
ncbi:radical SAM protein [Candidatus Woesearchaeota archaeon]|nr:radical SAM protein [Candidatus Woesearchaeota archaeon]